MVTMFGVGSKVSDGLQRLLVGSLETGDHGQRLCLAQLVGFGVISPLNTGGAHRLPPTDGTGPRGQPRAVDPQE